MKLKLLLIAGMMMLPVVGYAGEIYMHVPDNNIDVEKLYSAEGDNAGSTLCVPLDKVIKEWELTLKTYGQSIDVGGLTITTTECDPCKCPVNGMASCYEFMAEREKLKVEAYQIASEILELVKRYGVCK